MSTDKIVDLSEYPNLKMRFCQEEDKTSKDPEIQLPDPRCQIDDARITLEAMPEQKRTDSDVPEEMSLDALADILGTTIKHERDNSTAIFLCYLSTYLRSDSQFNISLNSPSATGKSYLATEIVKLFPNEDVREIGYCSPTAFFHEVNCRSNETKQIVVSFEGKILVFLDQPHNDLLTRLRPILSHDKKEIEIMITDKDQRFGMRTKKIKLIGFSPVIFCTAGLRMDEQELTRFMLLCPGSSQEKLSSSIDEKIQKLSDTDKYTRSFDKNQRLSGLKKRITLIKAAKIEDVIISDTAAVRSKYSKTSHVLHPKDQRYIAIYISLIKTSALLNLWHRRQESGKIFASQEDIDRATTLWHNISATHHLGLAPFIDSVFKDVFLELDQKKRLSGSADYGISRSEIISLYLSRFGSPLDTLKLTYEILPSLVGNSLIERRKSTKDRRQELIYITDHARNIYV